MGNDMLKDTNLKNFKNEDWLAIKLTNEFNSWIYNKKIPPYVKQARVVALSKPNLQFPAHGDIRVLAITQTITKVFEKILFSQLNEHMNNQPTLHQAQRDFVK